MTIKYEIHNQLTGLLEQAATFEEAKILKERIRAEYIASIESLFQITALVQNEDGSWTQSLADANGQPIVNSSLFVDWQEV
jgi:hypothetical protein